MSEGWAFGPDSLSDHALRVDSVDVEYEAVSMSIRAVSGLTWRKSSLVIAVVAGILLVLASSAMAANFGLWDQQPFLGNRDPLQAEPTEHSGSAPTLEVEGTVTGDRPSGGDLADDQGRSNRADDQPTTTVPTEQTTGRPGSGTADTAAGHSEDVADDELLKDNTLNSRASSERGDGDSDDNNTEGADDRRPGRGRGAGHRDHEGQSATGDGSLDDD